MKARVMGLRDFLARFAHSNRTDDSKKKITNRVDELANELHRTGRISELEAQLTRFNIGGLTQLETESWHHLWGIAAFQKGDHAVALQRFTEGVAACPHSQQIQFSLAQEYENIGDIDRMFVLFDECAFPGISARYALAQARYAYLWNRADKAIKYIQPIMNAYDKVGILDDTHLYLRGLPFYSETWSYLACFLELCGELPGLREITLDASKRLSDFPFDRLLTFVDCIESGDFKIEIEDLQKLISQRSGASNPIPNGYLLLKVAMLMAMRESDLEKAEGIIMAVPLSDQDFPWLTDIQLLAQCSFANQRGDKVREEQLQNIFVTRQPRLFEPNHIFNFRLTSYQESLKPKYQRNRRVA